MHLEPEPLGGVMLTFFGSLFGSLCLIALRLGGGWYYDDEKIPPELWRRIRPVLESLLVSVAVVFCVVTFGLMHVRELIAAPYFEYLAFHGSLIVGVLTYRIVFPRATRRAVDGIWVPLSRNEAAEMLPGWFIYTLFVDERNIIRKGKPKK